MVDERAKFLKNCGGAVESIYCGWVYFCLDLRNQGMADEVARVIIFCVRGV